MSVDTSTASVDGSKAADLLLERGIEAGSDISDPLNAEFATALVERLASGMTGAGSGWGLEEGYTPVIRMIRDPLAVLRCSLSTDIEITGILSCL